MVACRAAAAAENLRLIVLLSTSIFACSSGEVRQTAA